MTSKSNILRAIARPFQIATRSKVELILVFLFSLSTALILQGFADHRYFVRELAYLSAPQIDIKNYAKAGVYAISYLLSAGLLGFAFVQRSRLICALAIYYLSATLLVDLSCQLINSREGFTHFQYALFVNEAGNFKNLIAFSLAIGKALFVIGVFGCCAALLRRLVKIRLSATWLVFGTLFVFPLVITAKLGVHYISYTSYFPPIKVPIIISSYYWNKVEQPNRILPASVLPKKNKSNTIVLIIDESVLGTQLSINGYSLDTTPDIARYIGSNQITNFGVVNSNGNCSALSQLMLRVGLSSVTDGSEQNFIETRRKLPTIYQYAKRAGYKTWLIDAQVKEGTLTNYLTYDDLKSVDEYFTNSSRTEDNQRDVVGLEKLTLVLKKDSAEKKFIVFVKDGAHWPYLWRFPKSKGVFFPIQGSEYEPLANENKTKLLNTYANVLRYTVNDFLDTYLRETSLKDSMTFYTSDHGQAFLETGAKDKLTHCSTYRDPSSNQAAVPLMVIDQTGRNEYSPRAGKLYSQHQIFPTALREMGYSIEVTSPYGKTLEDGYDSDHKRWFYWSMEGDRSEYKSGQLGMNN